MMEAKRLIVLFYTNPLCNTLQTLNIIDGAAPVAETGNVDTLSVWVRNYKKEDNELLFSREYS